MSSFLGKKSKKKGSQKQEFSGMNEQFLDSNPNSIQNDDLWIDNNMIDIKEDANKKNEKRKCNIKCWSICFIIMSVFIIIVAIITRSIIVPAIAQSALDNTTMDIVSGTIYNPTQNSVDLNATLIVQNSGFIGATMKSAKVNVYYNEQILGSMIMPEIQTTANKPTLIDTVTTLDIENVTLFQESCKIMLNNIDQNWVLKADNIDVETKLLGIKINLQLNLNKNLFMKGSNLIRMKSDNIIVNDATKNSIETIANITYYSESIFTFILNDIKFNILYDNKYIGYNILNEMIIAPGFNELINKSLNIELTNNNQKDLNKFFTNYIGGNNQFVTLHGPFALNNSSVLDGIIYENINTVGYNGDPISFGGSFTSETISGYKVNGKTMRGANAGIYNPLAIPIRVSNMVGNAYFMEPFRYQIKTTALMWKQRCYEDKTTKMGKLSFQAGMYQDDPTKTYVDLLPNEKKSVFVIAEPQSSDKEAVGTCAHTVDYSCCWVYLSIAKICDLNRKLQKSVKHQLDMAYIPTKLQSNMTMLLNNKFRIDIQYNSDFVPIYFGYEMYAGFLMDAEMSCYDFTFQ